MIFSFFHEQTCTETLIDFTYNKPMITNDSIRTKREEERELRINPVSAINPETNVVTLQPIFEIKKLAGGPSNIKKKIQCRFNPFFEHSFAICNLYILLAKKLLQIYTRRIFSFLIIVFCC